MKFFLVTLLVFGGLIGLAGFFMTHTPGASFQGTLPALTDDEQDVVGRIRNHVETLSKDVGQRGPHATGGMVQAQDYMERQLSRLGLTIDRQTFESQSSSGKNVIGEMAGTTRHKEIVVIGAHCDSAKKSPGANANASGCAVLLEIARAVAQGGVNRTVRFVVFDRGEAPYAATEHTGAYAYAKRCKERGENVVAMISLDSLGYYTNKPGSQSCPFPLNCFFPDRGDFVAFVGDGGSRDLVMRCVELFRGRARFPCEGASMPGWLPGLRTSDQAGFWDFGYPAIVVTDTGTMRSEYNSTPSDTFDRLDYNAIARVTTGLTRVVGELTNKQAAITQ